MGNYSIEHILFLKKKKREHVIVVFFRLLILMIFLFVWEMLAKNGIINSFVFSCSSKVVKTLLKLFSGGTLFSHIGITFYEIIISFLLSSIVGIAIATLLWSNNMIHKILDPYLTIFNSLPKVALGPLIIIWFGAGINSVIFMGFIISIFVTIISIYQGFISTNINYITMLRCFNASKWQIFKYAVLPSNFKNIISALKVNISMNLIGIIMGELLVSKKGIGYLIMYGSQIFNIDLVITCIFILAIISYIMYSLVNKIK